MNHFYHVCTCVLCIWRSYWYWVDKRGVDVALHDTVYASVCWSAGEVKRLKAYKPWAAQVVATPPPSSDPLAPPPKKSSKQGKGDNDMALVAAIRNKVGPEMHTHTSMT
jgi:hypothetical protein